MEKKEEIGGIISRFENILSDFEDFLYEPKNDNLLLTFQAFQLGELLGGISVYLNFINIINEKIDINKNKELKEKLNRMLKLAGEIYESLQDPEEEYNPLYLGIEYRGLEEITEKILKNILKNC